MKKSYTAVECEAVVRRVHDKHAKAYFRLLDKIAGTMVKEMTAAGIPRDQALIGSQGSAASTEFQLVLARVTTLLSNDSALCLGSIAKKGALRRATPVKQQMYLR